MAEFQVGKLRGKPMDQPAPPPPTQSSICAVHRLVAWFVPCVTIELYCWYQILRRCQLVYKVRRQILKVEHDQLGSNDPDFQCKLNAPRTGLRPPPHLMLLEAGIPLHNGIIICVLSDFNDLDIRDIC